MDTTDCERSDEENRQRDSENENVTSGSRRRNNVTVQRENRPINEFSANDVLLLKAFPCYFMLGTGILHKGTQSPQAVRHMMFQFTNRMAQCHRLIFLLFDQKQRHSVAQIVSSKVKTEPLSLAKFGAMIKQPSFLHRVRKAASNPNSKQSKQLLKEIMPCIEVTSSKVPFTKASRKAALSKLLALTQYHGMPSIFFTISPDDIQDPNRIRMSLPQKNNRDFPAEAGGFLNALQNNDNLYAQVPINRNNLADLLVKSPVAAAEMFSMVVNSIFKVIFGIEPEKSLKKQLNCPIGSQAFLERQQLLPGCLKSNAGVLSMVISLYGLKIFLQSYSKQ